MPIVRIFIIACLALICTQAWAIDEVQFQKDLTALCETPARIVGSEGYAKSLKYVQQQLAALPGVEVERQDFQLMMPRTRFATLAVGGGAEARIYPFYPAGVRLNATPAAGIAGRLIYCGNAEAEKIPAKDVAGNIAIIEASARERWQQVAGLNPAAILVLGAPDTSHVDLRSHDLVLPVNLPRFFIPDGPLAAGLRSGALSGPAVLKAASDWRDVMASNLYAFVPAKTPSMPGWAGQGRPAALMFVVPIDSSSLVPDLSPGAGQAVQTAAGLALLRSIAATPLDRPVLVCFTSADSVQLLGTRNALLALAESPLRWAKELAQCDSDLLEAGAELARAADLSAGPEKINPQGDRGLVQRAVKLIETDSALEQDELFRIRSAPPGSGGAVSKARDAELSNHQRLLNELGYAFAQSPAELASADLHVEARRYLQKLQDRLRGGDDIGLISQLTQRQHLLQQRQTLYHWLAGKVGRAPDPAINDTSQRLIETMVALDVSDGGARAGPMYFGQFIRTSGIGDLGNYRDWFAKVDRGSGSWFAKLSGAIDFEPFNQLRSAQTYLAAPLPLASELASVWGVPGFAMVTLDDLRVRRDTPLDTLERVNVAAILPQLAGVEAVFRKAWNDPKFVGPPELKRYRNSVSGQVVSPASGRPVPDLPRPGFLATYYYSTGVSRRVPQLRPIPWTLGVRRSEVQACDAEGNYAFEGFPRLEANYAKEYYFLACEVYRIDPGTGAIVGCSDLGKQASDIRTYADLRQDQEPLRNLVFNCEEFALTGLYDPRFLQTLSDVLPLDARRNAEPQKFNLMIDNQLLAGFAEPGTKLELLMRYGRVGNRVLLLNMPEDVGSTIPGRGVGYTAPQLAHLGPLSLATSLDFWRLDDQRLREYRKAGVSSSLLDDLHARAGEQIKQAVAAQSANNTGALLTSANGAWANEARVYSAAQDMAHDVVRAAIFLLLLLVPFSFCMERLLIGTPSVYKQIGGIALIFSIMTGALWSFHPAFKISSSPLIVVLSFAIILMSVVVIGVVYGKFDSELKRIGSGRGSSASANFARASVLMSAVLLGIANMRKRRFRTALTSITIILITFAVLCFTSSARLLDTTTIPIGVKTSQSSLLIRQRGFRPIPTQLRDGLAAIVSETVGPHAVAERWWNVKSSDPNEQVDLTFAEGQTLRTSGMSAALGLSPGEGGVSNIAQVIGPSFARLEKGERDICYISQAAAATLKAKVGASIGVGGVTLKLAGIFDGDRFDSVVRTLAGEPLTPLKYTSGGLDASGRQLSDVDPNASSSEQFELDADSSASEASGNYEHLPASKIVIVPAEVSQMLQNASLRNLAIKLDDEAQVKKLSDELARRYAVALFGGFDDGVKLVAASNLASVSGAGQVAIPLAIAGLIIFNTMMGSIAERRREIHVYTSLGLAPLHVGALFLAEALTYGLIGTVFGYVIGQGAGTALSKLGWLGNVTLNYSGTSAMITMGLILVVVLLSAIIPARLASKIAAPSIDRTWKVPTPKGDLIDAQLPFTINRTAAEGALAYLAEFFEEHQEGSIGKFSAGRIETFSSTDAQHRPSRGLLTDIWLTPFDLGVRQKLQLVIHPGEFPDIYEVQVLLERRSGDDGSWYRMNRSFLTELRKQFLQWRSLTPQRMAEYIGQSRALFKAMPNDEFRTANGGIHAGE